MLRGKQLIDPQGMSEQEDAAAEDGAEGAHAQGPGQRGRRHGARGGVAAELGEWLLKLVETQFASTLGCSIGNRCFSNAATSAPTGGTGIR